MNLKNRLFLNLKSIVYIFIFCFYNENVLAKEIVNDVTRINPIIVEKVISPTRVEQIKNAIKSHPGTISIGGGRYSMGGQTATENSLQIDMRNFNKIINFDIEKKQITVQAGIRWRDIQEEIDKENLSIKIMQTYSNFTVGGSLSVNAHGRYIGEGPLVRSVESIKVVLADGNEVNASRNENSEIFYSVIGGYGAIGVITQATLNLVPNEKLRREIKLMPVSKYKDHFLNQIRDNKDTVLHNADLYPPDFNEVSLESWYRTNKALTNQLKLIPKNQKYWLEPNAISTISTLPFGSELRKKILDPMFHKKEVVVWRNYEASYDVAQLEPKTPRILFTYVLQEYFIPINQIDEFIPKMRNVFQKNNVNVVNVSIRHALPDKETYLTWAPEEVFSFVIYYKQSTTNLAKNEVAKWTRELIDAALSVNGRYYLPYQIHATNDQFKIAYPGHKRFFDVKKKMDSTNKFKNKLWDQYYQ